MSSFHDFTASRADKRADGSRCTITYSPVSFLRSKMKCPAIVGEATDARRAGHLSVWLNGILLDMVRSEATLALPLGELAAP